MACGRQQSEYSEMPLARVPAWLRPAGPLLGTLPPTFLRKDMIP